MDVAVVGAGRLGTAVAVLLERAGHRIVATSGRAATAERVGTYLPGVPFLEPSEAATLGELIVVAVPDDAIGSTVADLAGAGAVAPGAWVMHVSGSAGLEVLRPARDVGARILAAHPLQTFPDVDGALARIPGCAMALTAEDDEGFALGERLAADLGATPFRLADDRRPLYHAAAVFASNHLVTTASVAERLFADAGVPDPLGATVALQRATLDNLARLGAGDALTGPAVRGDAGTIARNLEALAEHAPETVPAYVAMARLALDLGVTAGRLDPGRRAAVEEALGRWS
jgi:predicted short-subunit dehydrogenase-like oxidoreductase (DUF2520 family)